jgi:hypothetical protein
MKAHLQDGVYLPAEFDIDCLQGIEVPGIRDGGLFVDRKGAEAEFFQESVEKGYR